MTVNLADSKLLKENPPTNLQLTFESEMTGSPKIQDFKSCVPRASWSSCSGHQEALGTRMLLILRERNFPNAKQWRKQVIKRLKGILSFSDQERALPGAHKLALHPSTEISVLAFNCEKKLQQLSGVSTFKEQARKRKIKCCPRLRIQSCLILDVPIGLPMPEICQGCFINSSVIMQRRFHLLDEQFKTLKPLRITC